MFVTKLNPTGSALVYSTFLGGTRGRQRLDASRSTAVATRTPSGSRARPTSRPPPARSTPRPNGAFDATLTKLNPAGSALVYSTYIGGSDFDSGGGVTVDGAGNAYVAGGTPSADFPTTAGAYDTTFNNGDAFVTKFNPAGSALVYSTFIGGSASDSSAASSSMRRATHGSTGGTNSADFPVTAGRRRTARSTAVGGRDHRRAERRRLGAASSRHTSAARSRRAAPTSPATRPATSTSPASRSRRTSRPRSARSTVCATAICRSSGATPSSRSSTINATASTPPAPPAVPAAPTLLSPSNASSQPQPITFDWSDVAERGRRTRSRSTTRARSPHRWCVTRA